jgi:hypothetical protein
LFVPSYEGGGSLSKYNSPNDPIEDRPLMGKDHHLRVPKVASRGGVLLRLVAIKVHAALEEGVRGIQDKIMSYACVPVSVLCL